MKHILVVDDSVTNLKIAKAALESEYKVSLLTSGEDALKFLEKRTPDLILLDIEMPGLNGFDVVEKFKQSGQMNETPVIFLTALINPEVEARALSMGVVDFINKPFATEALLSRVHLHLEINDYRKNLEKLVEESVKKLARVTAEKERINAELDIARHIQISMLPCVFPAYPERAEFDIFATMTPAKEVGGDFYDFFLIDGDRLGVVIADVSGKGVPAALFMVVAKTLIKNYALMNLSPAETFMKTNKQLCENNEANMFVTAFMGILNILTGEFSFVNAGHNFPLLRRAGKAYDWLKSPVKLVLAYTPDTRYADSTLRLEPNDMLLLYTDGVTEATDMEGNLFENERLVSLLNDKQASRPSLLLADVMQAVNSFAGDAPQFDDITMLGLLYQGRVHGSS